MLDKDILLKSIERHDTLILKNMGIRITLSEYPAYMHYIELRNELDNMNPIHRFFSWRLRRKCKIARSGALQATLNAVLDKLAESKRS